MPADAQPLAQKLAAPSRTASSALLGAVAGSDAGDTAVSSIGDARVSAAFSLGFEMARLIHHEPSTVDPEKEAGYLLTVLTHVKSKLAELRSAFEAEGVDIPPAEELEHALQDPSAQSFDGAARFDAYVATRLDAVSQRLGRAYRLGRSLAWTCFGHGELQQVFAAPRLPPIYASLTYLGSAFPPYAARAVKRSLAQWAVFAQAPRGVEGDRLSTTALSTQAEAWYGLLSGDIVATDMLDTKNYLAVARAVSRRMQALLGTVIQVYWAFVAVIVALLVGGVLLIVENGSAASGVAGIFAFIGSLGLGAKGFNVVSDLRQPLFDLEFSDAVADAITFLPTGRP
jgi:hypothetical protein